MRWTAFNFGIGRGKNMTLPQAIIKDPDWFFWLYEQKTLWGPLADEAEILDRRARNILLPGLVPGETEILYFVDDDGKFSDFQIQPASSGWAGGSNRPVIRRNVLDLSIPRQLKPYDKSGSKRIVRSLRDYVLGEGEKFTKKRCEKFFNTRKNFAVW